MRILMCHMTPLESCPRGGLHILSQNDSCHREQQHKSTYNLRSLYINIAKQDEIDEHYSRYLIIISVLLNPISTLPCNLRSYNSFIVAYIGLSQNIWNVEAQFEGPDYARCESMNVSTWVFLFLCKSTYNFAVLIHRFPIHCAILK